MTAPTDPRVQPGERGQRVSAETLADAVSYLDEGGQFDASPEAFALAVYDLRDARAEIARLTEENEALRKSWKNHFAAATAAEARVAELVEGLKHSRCAPSAT